MTVASELVDRFRADLAHLWAFVDDRGARLGLAVSGGGDSLAMLLLAQAALPGRVEAATVDHGLRPENAGEAAMVAERCRELAVPHAILPVEVARGNVQDRARSARYAVLGGWCEERGLLGIATAHQMDDQVETFLMRLNRGSGVGGLASIRALATVPGAGVRLVRPLLGWRRNELADIVATAGWEAAQDASNSDSSFDRVRIRQALAKTEWLKPEGVARSAQLLAEADETIAWMIGREYHERVTANAEEATYHSLRTGIGGTLVKGGVIQSIGRLFGASMDRTQAAAMVEALRRGHKVNVAGVQAQVRDVGGERVWHFAPEAPRQKG